jgi:hypothetical protein
MRCNLHCLTHQETPAAATQFVELGPLTVPAVAGMSIMRSVLQSGQAPAARVFVHCSNVLMKCFGAARTARTC